MGGQAASVGIKLGYLITSVGQKNISSVEEFVEAIKTTTRGGRILVRIIGDRYAHYVTMSVE